MEAEIYVPFAHISGVGRTCCPARMVKQLTVLSQRHGQLIKIGGNQLIFSD